MLKRLRLKDFKSFVDEQVELAPLTVLVGANAAGKSNFLDAIQFLHALNFDLSLAEILNGEERATPDAWPGLRGGSFEAARSGTASFSLESTWLAPHPMEVIVGSDEPHPDNFRFEVSHQITCQVEPRLLVAAEELRGKKDRVLFTTGTVNGDQIELPFPPFQWGRTALSKGPASTFVDAQRSVLWAILGFPLSANTPYVRIEVGEHASSLSEAFKRIESLNIKPEVMRGYGRRGPPLGAEGRNVSGVLAQLCDAPETKRTLVEWLAELCAPEISDVDFVEVKELGDVMAMFVEKSGKRISIRSLSDGTLRFLGTVLALRLATPGSIFLLEEIDAGLHPTRIRLLVEYLESIARERGTQIIATTHSPVMLQWLSPEALRSTIVFGRTPEHEGTVMRRLGDLPHFDTVVQRKGIDELFTTGWLEMAL